MTALSDIERRIVEMVNKTECKCDPLVAVDDPNWDGPYEGPWDWRHCITSDMANMWELLSRESRLALLCDAATRASHWNEWIR